MRRFDLFVLAIGLVACSYPASQTYRASETGKKLEVEHAVVVSSREVTVTEDPDVNKNWYGPLAGATVGGVSATAGGASDAIVIGAAVIGLGLGFLIEEAADTRKGHEYIRNPRPHRRNRKLPPGRTVAADPARKRTEVDLDQRSPGGFHRSFTREGKHMEDAQWQVA
jgi:outer membrane lipoprotein SlyB